MIYSSRLKKILQLCLSKDAYVKVDTLAALLKISTRTIFRELKDIDHDLKSYHLTFISKPGKGIMISGSEENKRNLLDELNIQGITYVNKEERQNLLTFELLRSTGLEKLLHYANLFQVSEATISNDLDQMEPWFEKQKVVLMRKPGLGVEVLCSEADKRRVMTNLLNQKFLQKETYESLNYLDAQTLLKQIFTMNDDSILRLLNQEILVRMLDLFQTHQHELKLDRYAQSSYIGLIIHLVIAVDRIWKHEEIEANDTVLAIVKDDVSFQQAQQLAEHLETEFDIDIPEVEIAFIALHLKGAKITKVACQQQGNDVQQPLLQLIEDMFDVYDASIASYLRQDQKLIQGLLTHLGPTITRLKNHLPIYNPLLAQIKQEYAQLFETTKKACACLSKLYACEVNDDEVGFITMHIGAALDRRRYDNMIYHKVTIGVVCASGIGVSALLSARLQKAFPSQLIVHVLSMDDIQHKNYATCEFLISTFPLNASDRKVILVSPLLTKDDIREIEQAFTKAQKNQVEAIAVHPCIYHDRLSSLLKISKEACNLMNTMQWKHVYANMQLDEMIELTAATLAATSADEEAICTALRQREQMGSAIMKDYGFALLHAKTTGVSHSHILLLYPTADHFLNRLDGIGVVIVLLMAQPANQEQQALLSLFSRSLIEQDILLKAIINQEHDQIIELYSMLVLHYLDDILLKKGEE